MLIVVSLLLDPAEPLLSLNLGRTAHDAANLPVFVGGLWALSIDTARLHLSRVALTLGPSLILVLGMVIDGSVSLH